MWSLKGINSFKVLQFLVVTDKYFVSWFDSRPGPDMTTHVRYSRCKGTECPVVPQSICQYSNITWFRMNVVMGKFRKSHNFYHKFQKVLIFLIFFSKLKKKSPILWKCSKNLYFLRISEKNNRSSHHLKQCWTACALHHRMPQCHMDVSVSSEFMITVICDTLSLHCHDGLYLCHIRI